MVDHGKALGRKKIAMSIIFEDNQKLQDQYIISMYVYTVHDRTGEFGQVAGPLTGGAPAPVSFPIIAAWTWI